MVTSPNANAYGGASAAENPFDYLAQAQNRLGQRNYRTDLRQTQQQEQEAARLQALNDALAQAGDWFSSAPVAGATPNPTGRIDDISQNMISAAGGPDMDFARFQDGLQEQMAGGRAAEPMVDNFATMAGGVSDLANAGQVYPGGLDIGGMTVGDFNRPTSWGLTPDQSMGYASRGSGENNEQTYDLSINLPVDDGTGEYRRIDVEGIPWNVPPDVARQQIFNGNSQPQTTSSGSYIPRSSDNPAITSAKHELQRKGFTIDSETQLGDKLQVDMTGPDGRPNTVIIDSNGDIE